MITENLSTLKIHKLTQEQYDREVAAGNIDETAIYLTPDEGVDLSDYVTSDTLSNMLLISGGTNFKGGENLDDYTTPGVYISGSTGMTTNLDHTTNPGNVPVTTGFKMFVIGGYIESRVDQFITTNSNAIWHRKYNGSSWSTWERFYTSTNPPKLSELGLTASAEELNYVDGVTSSIQTQLDDKMASTNPTGTGSLSINRKSGSTVGVNSTTIGVDNIASGASSFASGDTTKALGGMSHAEGAGSEASGDGSHAEGIATFAMGTGSHTEGCGTIVTTDSSATRKNDTLDGLVYGDYSHAEGYSTTVYGAAAHAEGANTLASGLGSHAEGRETIASGECSHAEGYGLDLNYQGSTGPHSHSEGYSCNASHMAAHAEGRCSTASGQAAHAEGWTSDASGQAAHAEGGNTTASGISSHAEGNYTTASGDGSHAEGNHTTASGEYSHAEGGMTVASGVYSHAGGCWTTALDHQHTIGHYNNTSTAIAGCASGTSNGTAFVIGNGTSTNASNACRITFDGGVIGKTAYSASGADYAEYFEWADGNIENEERVGYFVTFEDVKFIRKANEGDYILGIVSGNPSVLGNHDECWMGRNEMDEWGRFIYVTETETDKVTGEVREYQTYKVNPNYDDSIQYIPRSDRPEWDAIGMLGLLSVRDDGTCQVNGYCKVADGGIATASDVGYRVVERITDNIVKIIFR